MWHNFCIVILLELTHISYAFPVDLTSVNPGQFNSLWLATSPVLAVAFFLIVIGFLFGCVCCRNGKGFEEFRNSTGGLSIVEGDSFTSPTAELTIFPPNGVALQTVPEPVSAVIKSSDYNHYKLANLRPATFSSGDQNDLSCQDWFYDPQLNFPRNQLRYVEDYGRGWFGRVVEGEATYIDNVRPKTKVIVKILHEDASTTDQMFFLHEVKCHRDLNHPNILSLLGRCLEIEPFLLLLEHCPNGDLKTFLTSNLSSAYALSHQGITLRMAFDITNGLDFMHQNKFIHTDLATRNCLVASDLSIKIGDYGNAIEIHPGDYYIAGSVALPVRWCAPETLKCTECTIETGEVDYRANVWTLGVVLWEIFMFGGLPYKGLTDEEVIAEVIGGSKVLGQPDAVIAPFLDELYRLMKLCWNAPLQRPTVSQIKAILENLVSCSKTLHNNNISTDFDERWQQSKPNNIPKTDNAKPSGAKVADSCVESPLHWSEKKSVTDSPRILLKRSDSTRNLSGSLENLNLNGEEELDSWLKGVEVQNDEDKNVVRGISEAIRDLDAALALEKTSSSEEASGISSKQSSPSKEISPVVDFKLGENTTSTFLTVPPKSFELSSLQNTFEPQSLNFASFIFPEVQEDLSIFSVTDAEEQLWRKRIEEGEFTEKVQEKSKSIADLMVLTHISDDSDGSERGFDANINRNSFHRKLAARNSISSANFGSDTDIRNVVLEEEFKENLKKLSQDHREFGKFDSLSMILPGRDFVFKKDNFLSNVASEQIDNIRLEECASSRIPEISVEEIPPIPGEEEIPLKFDYPVKNYRFVYKEDSCVVLGANEDHTLKPYQGLKTTFKEYEEFEGNYLNKETNLDLEEDKLRTPDDERSSDSGFRDKGSLSESVEDACEGKYNLEDIEAELEEAYVKGAFDETKFYEQKEDDWSKDSQYFSELTEENPAAAKGWYLDPPDENSDKTNPPPDEEFVVTALRNELLEKLPNSVRSFEFEGEVQLEDDDKNVVNISYPKLLETILEDPDNLLVKSPPLRKNYNSNLMESVKAIDNETFKQYLEYMVENEGKFDSDDESFADDKNKSFENEILKLLGEPQRIEMEEPTSLLVFDDLDSQIPKIVPETKQEEDLLLVDAVTNEATILESPRPKSQIAFADFSSPEVSVNEASTDITSSPELLSDFSLTPFESPRTVPQLTKVEEIRANDEAREIVYALAEYGIGSKTATATTTTTTKTDDLLMESSKKLQQFEKFEMSTSFREDVSEDEGKSRSEEKSYTPDWEDSADEETSSSGEFIWKEGEMESKVKVRDAVCPADSKIPLYDDDKEKAEGENEENDDSSVSSESIASITEFVPSAWNSLATPSKSALKDPNKTSGNKKRNVWFKREKYQCVYEYPREPSDVEDNGFSISSVFDYSQYQDWDVQCQDFEMDPDTDDTDSSDAGKSKSAPVSSYQDFYTLSPLEDFLSTNGATGEEGEFFVTSTTRPFQATSFFTGSQFMAFNKTDWHQTSPTTEKLLDVDDFTTPDSGVEDLSMSMPSESKSGPVADIKQVSYVPVGKKPAREHLTLDLPRNHNAEMADFKANCESV